MATLSTYRQVNGFVVDFDMGPDAGLYFAVMRIPPEESVIFRMTPRVPLRCDPGASAGTEGAPGKRADLVRPRLSPAGGGNLGRWVVGLALLAAAVVVVLEVRKG
jgi:hypothetical protein